jgi:two-component system response regulator
MQHEASQIVLVEDSPHDRELTLRALRRTNLVNPVVTLNDGAEALDYFFGPEADTMELRRRTSLVLLDLKLPRVDGIEVLRRLKSHAGTKSIPVAILTSSAEERDRLASYDIGANSYVVKPIDFQQFVSAVAELGFYWCVLNLPVDGRPA